MRTLKRNFGECEIDSLLQKKVEAIQHIWHSYRFYKKIFLHCVMMTQHFAQRVLYIASPMSYFVVW